MLKRAPQKVTATAAPKPAPVATRKAPPAPSAIVRKVAPAPAPMKRILPAPSASRPLPVARMPTFTVETARKAMLKSGELLTELQKASWVAMDGKQTKLDMPENAVVDCAGLWLSVFRHAEDNSVMVSVSQIARSKSHSADTIGTLCERRYERPL